MKYVIVKVNAFYFIKTMSDSMSRHWDVLSEIPYNSLEEAKAYLKFHKEIYGSQEYESNFEICYSE